MVQAQTETVTETQLVDILKTIKGSTFATVYCETDPRMRKTANPYNGNVLKVSSLNGLLNAIYERSVNSQRTREGEQANFEAKPRKWGVKLDNVPLVEHKGAFYLSIQVKNDLSTTYKLADTGEEIDKATLEPWLPASRSSSGHQGIDKEIIPRDVKISNITAVAMKGVRYEVQH